jgi:replicative DNA helicase
MVKLNDPDNKISNDIIKIILKNNISDKKEWLETRFRAWKLSNIVRNNTSKTIEELRSLEDIDLENVKGVVAKIRNLYNEIPLLEDDFDIGDDFDDPENHKQEISKYKIPTGWSNIDKILSGGWDLSTFNVLMGETNVGKSMWLHNIGVNSAEQGKVVVVITLEMASRKVMKRMGSMRLKIDINQYDELSKDPTFIKTKINQVKNKNNGMFNTDKPGKIFVKKFNTGDCSIVDIDNYINKLQEVKNLHVDMVLVDYINIMTVDSSSKDIRNNLYLKGKHLAEGLRYLADKYNTVVITATQLDRAVWGANDVKLNDIPESKAIAETADSVWAIIRTSSMKKENKYRLKILKLRDGEHKEEQVRFDFNIKYLTIENDILEGTV